MDNFLALQVWQVVYIGANWNDTQEKDVASADFTKKIPPGATEIIKTQPLCFGALLEL